MKASTRRWVSLSALGLLALDLGAFAIAAPRAKGWLEGARASRLARAGAAALRDLERVGSRGAEDAGLALLTHFTRRSGRAYALILRATPSTPASLPVRSLAPLAPLEVLEPIPFEASVPAVPEVPSCPLSTCPRHDQAPSKALGSSAIGLPTSALRVTVE